MPNTAFAISAAFLAAAFSTPSLARSESCAEYAAQYNALIDTQKTITQRLKASKECSAEFFEASAQTSRAYLMRADVSRKIIAECPQLKVISAVELVGLANKMTDTSQRLKALC